MTRVARAVHPTMDCGIIGATSRRRDRSTSPDFGPYRTALNGINESGESLIPLKRARDWHYSWDGAGKYLMPLASRRKRHYSVRSEAVE